MQPLVTVLVVTYNHELFIGDCLKGAVSQSYKNLQILVLDDASTDATQIVARSHHDKRIEYVRRPTNCGLVRNYNEGLALARGKYIWAMGGDDFLVDPDAVSAAVVQLESDKELGFLFHRPASNSEDAVTFCDWGPEPITLSGYDVARKLCERNSICSPATIIRGDLLHRVGRYPAEFGCVGDLYVWFRAALQSQRIGYRPEQSLFYRRHERNLSAVYTGELQVDKTVQSTQLRLLMLSQTSGLDGFEASIMSVLRRNVRTLLQSWMNDRSARCEIAKALDRRLEVPEAPLANIDAVALLKDLFRDEVTATTSTALRHLRPGLLLRSLELRAALPRFWKNWG